MRLTYLLVLAGCLLATLPLEIVLNASVYRRWQRAFLAILPVSIVFLAWDLLATYAGWWWFDDDYVTVHRSATDRGNPVLPGGTGVRVADVRGGSVLRTAVGQAGTGERR